MDVGREWMILKAVSILLLCLMSLDMAMATDARVIVIADENNSVHQQFITGFRDALDDVSVVELSRESVTPEIVQGAALVVPLGIQSARQAYIKTLQIPVLYSLITATDWKQLNNDDQVAPYSTVLYLGQPPSRMLALVKTALPQRKKLTLLLGPTSQDGMGGIVQGCLKLALHCDSVVALDGGGIDRAQLQAAANDKVLLVLPDSDIVNASTARNLILGSYRRGVALVGYSRALVKAGALMAVYSTPVQLGKDTAEMARDFLQQRGQRLPPASYPSHFMVAVNYQLARALEIRLDTESDLAEGIDRTERNE